MLWHAESGYSKALTVRRWMLFRVRFICWPVHRKTPMLTNVIVGQLNFASVYSMNRSWCQDPATGGVTTSRLSWAIHIRPTR